MPYFCTKSLPSIFPTPSFPDSPPNKFCKVPKIPLPDTASIPCIGPVADCDKFPNKPLLSPPKPPSIAPVRAPFLPPY